MVKYILQEYAASQMGGMSEMSDEERMDYLLSKIQEVGMLPPSYEFKMGGQTIRDNCWEAEDETN